MSDDIYEVVNGGKSFLSAVEKGLAEEKKPAKPADPKKAALAAWKKDMEESYGPAGSVALELFKKGKGVHFYRGKDGTPVAEVLPDGTAQLRMDGEDVEGYETLRKYLQEEEKSSK